MNRLGAMHACALVCEHECRGELKKCVHPATRERERERKDYYIAGQRTRERGFN